MYPRLESRKEDPDLYVAVVPLRVWIVLEGSLGSKCVYVSKEKGRAEDYRFASTFDVVPACLEFVLRSRRRLLLPAVGTLRHD